VATAVVRARRAGQAIVNEARRRGVEAIVLAAEEPSRVRGGALLGGVSGPLDNYVGDVTKYVIRKAPCRVILTAPPADWREKFERDRPPAEFGRDRRPAELERDRPEAEVERDQPEAELERGRPEAELERDGPPGQR
jgi:hypothetical protein